MATKSKRQKIVDKIDEQLKQIREVSGYETDLGADVAWWLMNAIDPEALSASPKICCRDRDRAGWGNGVGQHLHQLDVTGEIYLSPDRTIAARQMRQVIADMTTCIGRNLTWGGLAEDTSIPSEEALEMVERENCYVAIGLTFTVTFLTDPWSAYQ
jgi:hypothetical protein